MVAQRREILLPADVLQHRLIAVALRIGVFPEDILRVFPLPCEDHAPRDQVEIRLGAGKIQEPAPVHQRRAGGPHMNLLCPALVEEFRRLPQLRPAHDGIVDQQQLLVLDQRLHRQQFHSRDQVALVLAHRHEGTRPGRRIFDKWPGKRYFRFVGVADGVSRAGIRHAGYHVRTDVAGSPVAPRQRTAAAVTHFLHIDSLIGRRRIPVINPEKRTDLQLIARRGQLLDAVRRYADDLAGTQLPLVGVAQIQIGETLHGNAVGAFLPAEHEGRAADLVPGRVDAVVPQDQHGHRAVHDILHIANALHQAVPAADQRPDQLGHIDLSVGHFLKMRIPVVVKLPDQPVIIIHLAHGGDGKTPQMRLENDRLRLEIRDTGDPVISGHFFHIMLEFGPERRILDVVDRTVEAFGAVGGHAAPAGAEMRMVIHPVENFVGTILPGNDSE